MERVYGIRKNVIEQIKELASRYQLDRVILFGSRARGDYHKTSDIDLAASGGNVTEFALDVDEDYYTSDYMYVTVTNDTEEPVYDVRVAVVLLDAEGNILYIGDESMYNKAIMPGSSVLIREEIPSYFSDCFEKNGYTPSAVDAIAYAETYQP